MVTDYNALAQQPVQTVPDYRVYAVIDSMGWDLDGQERDDMYRLCRAMLAAAPAAPATPAAPAGWKLVPVESSIDMEDAGRKAASRFMGLSEANRVYRAMLAAAPAAPVAPHGWVLPSERLPKSHLDVFVLRLDGTICVGRRNHAGHWQRAAYQKNRYQYGIREEEVVAWCEPQSAPEDLLNTEGQSHD